MNIERLIRDNIVSSCIFAAALAMFVVSWLTHFICVTCDLYPWVGETSFWMLVAKALFYSFAPVLAIITIWILYRLVMRQPLDEPTIKTMAENALRIFSVSFAFFMLAHFIDLMGNVKICFLIVKAIDILFWYVFLTTIGGIVVYYVGKFLFYAVLVPFLVWVLAGGVWRIVGFIVGFLLFLFLVTCLATCNLSRLQERYDQSRDERRHQRDDNKNRHDNNGGKSQEESNGNEGRQGRFLDPPANPFEESDANTNLKTSDDYQYATDPSEASSGEGELKDDW